MAWRREPLPFWLRLLNLLPVAAVFLLSAFITAIYISLHLKRLLQWDLVDKNRTLYYRGIWESVVACVFFVQYYACLIAAWAMSPGIVPLGGKWDLKRLEEDEQLKADLPTFHEAKKSSPFRTCKWCRVVKPDRTHHCSRCRQCILRMDHHCPWINNCVGWNNHKFFLLAVFYGLMSSTFVVVTQLETLAFYNGVEEISLPELWAFTASQLLATVMACVLVAYFAFLLTLLCSNITTVEFCEKNVRMSGRPNVNWSQGASKNIKDILGSNPILWFLPLDFRIAGGEEFERNAEKPYLTTAEEEEEIKALMISPNDREPGS